MGLKKKAAVAPVTNTNEEAPKVSKKSVKKEAPVPETPVQLVEETVEVKETVTETQPTTEIAERANTELAAPPRTPGGVLAQSAAEGFEGLDIGFGSYPILKIDGESFDLDGETLEGDSIHLQIMQSRTKWIIKQAGKGDGAEFIYSYDKQYDTSGGSVVDWVNKQNLAGNEVEYKEYLECVAQVLEEGEYEDDIIIMSIPPSGVKRFSGYVASLRMKRGVNPSTVITKAMIGKKIKKGKISWCPWSFKFVSMAE